jgi:hypothetical protein
MNIAWVFGANLQLPPDIDVMQIKNSAPIWGSWKLWRPYQIDNAVCANPATADRLIQQQYYNYCNLYVPHIVSTGTKSVKHFGGTFDYNVTDIEDLVAMHLAAHLNDVVLLMGIDFTKNIDTDYCAILVKTIETYSEKQWVLVDGPNDVDKIFESLKNFTCDKLQNALQLLL